jgi:hypothetical protein
VEPRSPIVIVHHVVRARRGLTRGFDL